MSQWGRGVMLVVMIGALSATPVFAMETALADVYAVRGDLQAAFAQDGTPEPGSRAGFLMNLEDWARQYGWQEYPELAAYAPDVEPPSAISHSSPIPAVSSGRYIVIDNASGIILAAQNAEVSWPIASITKLMSTTVALDGGIDVGGVGDVRAVDDVGGAKLYVNDGTTFTTRDLLAATLVGSANNAANAVARLAGIEKSAFVSRMNAYAEDMGLSHSSFVDPTGIELGNVSTAREVAALARTAFANENIRQLCGSVSTHIEALNDASYVRDIKNTNWLLYDAAYDDVYVTAGKTGYLDESGWNLVVQMHPMGDSDRDRSLTVVTLGAAGRRESFDDAANLARWAWKNFTW